jgi:hypothetical protein
MGRRDTKQSSSMGHDCLMGGDLYLRRSQAVRGPAPTAPHDRTRAAGPALLADRFQQLQRQAGS